MNKYKVIDLFAGIGGIRLGFDQAFGEEIKTVFVSEWDEWAQKTYKANFLDNFDINGDITNPVNDSRKSAAYEIHKKLTDLFLFFRKILAANNYRLKIHLL